MSLVNLSHVCSHLQNASLARLGLTSVPYSRLHLSLSLLLHKQGFLSQVKIGGLSPPASCFAGNVANNDLVTAQPHTDRSSHGPTSALTDLVMNGKQEADLHAEGYGQEAIDFAVSQKELSQEQLEQDGWNAVAIDFLLQYGLASPALLAEHDLDASAIALIHKYGVKTIADTLLQQHPEQAGPVPEIDPEALASRPHDITYSPALMLQLRTLLHERGIDLEDLQFFARDAKYTQPRHLARDGVTVQAMGLAVKNQAFTELPEQYRDPWQLDQEGVVTQANRASRRLWLGLKYWQGRPVLSKAKMLSKPTKRIWLDHKELGRIVRGSRAGEVKPMTQIGEIIAVSTDRGVMEARECIERKIGGMVLCRVW